MKMVKKRITSIVDGNKVSLAEFKKNARYFWPEHNKKLVKNGKVIATYSAKTKRVTVLR